jgi:exodeoxyribonuclease VII large subunit
MDRVMELRLEQWRKALAEKERALGYLSPDSRLEQIRQELVRQGERLSHAVQTVLFYHEKRFESAVQRLHALSPLATLDRGYSAVRDAEGRVVSSVSGLRQGDRVRILMRDGDADAQILSTHEISIKEDSHE